MPFNRYSEISFQHAQSCGVNQPICAWTTFSVFTRIGFGFGHFVFYFTTKIENASIEVESFRCGRIKYPEVRREAVVRL